MSDKHRYCYLHINILLHTYRYICICMRTYGNLCKLLKNAWYLSKAKQGGREKNMYCVFLYEKDKSANLAYFHVNLNI